METFTPLTPQQFQAARAAGFSAEKIIENEKRRKSEFELKNQPTPQKKEDTFLDNPITRTLQKFPGQEVGKSIGTLGGYAFNAAREALGFAPKGSTAAYDTSAPTPLQTVGDTAKGAALIGGLMAPNPTSLLGVTSAGAKFGALAGAGQAAVDSPSLDKALPIPSITEPLKGAFKGAVTGGATAGVTYGIGKLFQKAGDKIMNSVIRPSQADIEDGFSIENVKKYNLGGSLHTTYKKTQDKMSSLTNELTTRLKGSNNTIDLAGAYDDTVKELTKAKLSNFGSNTSTKNALSQLENEILTVNPSGAFSIPDAQKVKQAAGHMGAWSFGQTDPDSTARQRVYNTFYRVLKEKIEKNSPAGVRAINKQLSELIPIMNAVIRRIPVAERNNIISLSDMVGLVGGTINPSAWGGLALNLASKSGTVGKYVSKFGTNVKRLAPAIGAKAGAISGASSGTNLGRQ